MVSLNRHSRRALFTLAGAAGATAALSGCGLMTTTTSASGVTTVTLDTAKINTDGQALIAALTALLSAPSIASLLGTTASASISLAMTAANGALTQIQAMTNGAATVTMDPTSVQSFVSSMLKSASTILTLVQAALTGATSAIATTIGNYISAAQALIPLIALAAAVALPVGARLGAPGVTEAWALKAAYAQ